MVRWEMVSKWSGREKHRVLQLQKMIGFSLQELREIQYQLLKYHFRKTLLDYTIWAKLTDNYIWTGRRRTRNTSQGRRVKKYGRITVRKRFQIIAKGKNKASFFYEPCSYKYFCPLVYSISIFVLLRYNRYIYIYVSVLSV